MLQFHPIFLAKLAESRFPERYYEICRAYGFGEAAKGGFSAREIVTALKPVAEVHAFPGPGRAFEVRMLNQPEGFSFSFIIEFGDGFNPCIGITSENLKLQNQMCSIVADISDALGKTPPNPRYPKPTFITLPGLAACAQDHYELSLLFYRLYGEALSLVGQPCTIIDNAEYRKQKLAMIPRVDVARTVTLFNHRNIEAIHKYVLELSPSFSEHPTAAPSFLFTLLAREFASMPFAQIRALHDQLESRYLRRDIIMGSLEPLLGEGKVTEAEQLVDLIHEDMAYQGQRRMLRYFAANGDLDGYKSTLKKSDRRKHKSELKQIEAEMAANYSANAGLEPALVTFGSDNPYLVFLMLKAQIGKLAHAELSQMSSRLLESQDLYLYLSLHVEMLSADASRGIAVSANVRKLLGTFELFNPKEKSYGNIGTRQELLHRLGMVLLKHNQAETVEDILRLMSRSSHRSDLQRCLKQHKSGPAKA